MKLVSTMAAATLAFVSSSAAAGVFKCTDGTGKVSYQQQPCPQASSAQTLTTDSSTWVLVRTVTMPAGGQIEKFLDVGKIKTIGSLKRAIYKDVVPTLDGSKKITGETGMYYHYYDCAAGTISGHIPDIWRAQFEQDLYNGKDVLFPYEKLKAIYHEPQGDADIVEKVCRN